MASYRSVNAASSLIAVRVSGGRLWVGELCAVFVIKQDHLNIDTQTFGFVRWFRPAHIDLSGTVCAAFESLTVQIWDLEEYLTAADDGPDSLINLTV
ncbi:hypothetical protein C8R44DRAFT_868418 [Mycena epipterygia]|nr:hypothetical protein C8R44DRAFT_868418 [Mycena epipterygia]